MHAHRPAVRASEGLRGLFQLSDQLPHLLHGEGLPCLHRAVAGHTGPGPVLPGALYAFLIQLAQDLQHTGGHSRL